MKRILVVDDHEMTRDLVEMYLESYFDLTPSTSHSGQHAISILKKGPDFQIIISDYNMPNGNGGELFNFCTEEKLDLDFVLVTAEPRELLTEFNIIPDEKRFGFLQKPYNAEQFQEVIKPFINAENPSEALSIPEYMKVRIKKFIKYCNCSVDAFLKLSDKKMIKISNRVDKASLDQLLRYEEKGAEYIYLNKSDFEIFINTGMDEALVNLDKQTGTSLVDGQKNAMESIHEGMKFLGVSEKVLNVVDSCFSATMRNLEKNPKLKDLLPSFKDGEDNYKYNLSIACSYLSLAIGSKVDFCDNAGLEKLATAALFQDLSLDDLDCIKITDCESVEFKALSSSQKKMLKEHPNKSIELLDKHGAISTDVKNIILQHHELPSGLGFPRGINQSLTAPLSCIFILSHDLSTRLLSKDTLTSDLGMIYQNFKKNYDKGNYKKAFEAFSKVFNNLK